MSDLTSVSIPMSPVEVLRLRRFYVRETLEGATKATPERLEELRQEIAELTEAVRILTEAQNGNTGVS